MTVIDRIFNRFGYVSEKKAKQEFEAWLLETADAQRFDIPTPDIFANQADMYRLSSDLGSALDILADDVGLSRLNVFRMVGEERRDIPNHEFELLLRSPNPLDTGMELMRDTVIGYKLNGNYIWWLNRESEYEKPKEIWPIPYQMVEPVPDGRMYLKYYNYFPGAGKPPIPFPTWQIVHFKTYNPASRFWGLSPIESLALTLEGSIGMRKTKRQQYTTRGGSPPDILAFKDYPSREAWSEIKNEIEKAARLNKTMMLRGVGDGVTWLSRAMSSKDSEFNESLREGMETVFNRMAPGLLAMLSETSNVANALAARATYSEKALWKTLETFAQKITSSILPSYGRKLYAEFDDPRVVDRKLELDEQAAYERTHTIEEVRREKYGDNPLGDERDKLFVAEIRTKASSPFGNDQPEELRQEEQPIEKETGQDTGEDETGTKAVTDLKRLRIIALRGKAEKAQAFTSKHIPDYVLSSLKARLDGVTDKRAISNLFNDTIERMERKPTTTPEQVLAGIESGLRALELRN